MVAGKKQILEISEQGLKLGGEKFYLASGDVHYFRIMPEDWERRLFLARDFGLTAIQTYVPWHLHEPHPGTFDFSGRLDLKRFLELADRMGLKVMLRPAPYICSECDFGGLPSWLLKNKDIHVRCMDKEYMAAVEKYYERLTKEFVPMLSTNGGPIIAVAIENEYGSSGDDKEYLWELTKILVRNGVDVPLYTTDGELNIHLTNGTLPGCWAGVNFRAMPQFCKNALDKLKKFKPEFPLFVGEFWSGRSAHWGYGFHHLDPVETAKAYKYCLERGAYVNFYMFSGGTNFGFTSGGIMGGQFEKKPGDERKFATHLTSYDVDALVSEDGTPKEKYFLCRDVLDEYRNKPKRPHIAPNHPTQSILGISLNQIAFLLENKEEASVKCVESVGPYSMEDLDQNFGYVLYSAEVPGSDADALLRFESMNDRANIYMDGKYITTYMRDRKMNDAVVHIPKEGAKLDILVENLGRHQIGICLRERKGILGEVALVGNLYHWTNWSMPLENLDRLRYRELQKDEKPDCLPVFLKGTFQAQPGIDTYVDMHGFGHGNVWINGFNLGRYWNIGPQMTLYLPGSLLKEKDNVIEILDTEYTGEKKHIDLIDHSILEGDGKEDF